MVLNFICIIQPHFLIKMSKITYHPRQVYKSCLWDAPLWRERQDWLPILTKTHQKDGMWVKKKQSTSAYVIFLCAPFSQVISLLILFHCLLWAKFCSFTNTKISYQSPAWYKEMHLSRVIPQMNNRREMKIQATSVPANASLWGD